MACLMLILISWPQLRWWGLLTNQRWTLFKIVIKGLRHKAIEHIVIIIFPNQTSKIFISSCPTSSNLTSHERRFSGASETHGKFCPSSIQAALRPPSRPNWRALNGTCNWTKRPGISDRFHLENQFVVEFNFQRYDCLYILDIYIYIYIQLHSLLYV